MAYTRKKTRKDGSIRWTKEFEPSLPHSDGDRCGRGDPEGQAPHLDDAAARAARAPGLVARAQGGDAAAARLSRGGGAAAGREDGATRALNPGAELMAEGDITVWGALRGIAHAGIGGNVNAEIRALKLQPIQRTSDL